MSISSQVMTKKINLKSLEFGRMEILEKREFGKNRNLGKWECGKNGNLRKIGIWEK